MSNAIRDVEKAFNRQLESAKRRNDRELKALNDAHGALKAEMKKAQANEIVEIQDEHHRHMNAEADKKEKLLTEMRDHLQKTSELTDKELKALKQNAEAQNTQLERRMSDQRQRLNDENQLYLEEINDRHARATSSVNEEGKKRIDDMKSEMTSQYSDKEGFYNKRLNDQTNEFTTRFKQEGMNYKKMKDDQDNEFKKTRMATNTRQQVEISKLTETHNQNIETRDTEYRKGLKGQDLFFEGKYKTQLDRHNADFKDLEDKNQKVIADLKESLRKEISQTANRQDDEFYQFTSLRPRMQKFEDHIKISVEVPEYAKSDVQLTTNIKEAIVSLNRRYSDANKNRDGVINKVSKVESFSTRIPTDYVLDPKSVKATYEDGVMTYIIKKA